MILIFVKSHDRIERRKVDEISCKIWYNGFNGGCAMVIQGYFDGTAVRTLEPVNLEMNQTVYISIPSRKFSMDEENLIKNQIAALDDVCGMLTEDESSAVDKSINRGIHFKRTTEL